jgi:two-component system response regulator YesN
LGEKMGQVRLARARQLLCETGVSLAEVAQAAGFRNCSSFTRSFKRRFGVSPGEMRAGRPSAAGGVLSDA